MIKITTPVQGYTGTDCGIIFENGSATVETLSEHVYNWFKTHGYTVEGELDVPVTDPEAGKTEQPKTKAELIEEAKALGIENIKSKATVAELQELIANKKAELEAAASGSEDPNASNPENGEENGEPENGDPVTDPEAGEQGNEDSKGGE